MKKLAYAGLVAIGLLAVAGCSSGLPNAPDSGVGVGDAAAVDGGNPRTDSASGMDSTTGADTGPAMDSTTATDTSTSVDSASRPDTGKGMDSEADVDTGTAMDSTTGVDAGTGMDTGTKDSTSGLETGTDAGQTDAGSPLTLTVVSGDGQTGYPAQETTPIALKLINSTSQQPVGNTTLTVSAPAGIGITPAVVTTNPNGMATVLVWRSLRVGTDTLSFSASSSNSVDVTVVTQAPAAGTVFTILNAPRVALAPAVLGAAVLSPTGRPVAFAADTSGGFYYSDLDHCAIFHIDANGVLSSVTKLNGGCADSGDYGPANLATTGSVDTAFLEPSRNTLTFGEFSPGIIRQIDLGTGVITPLVGGGTAMAALGQLATNVSVSAPLIIAVLPGGNLWFASQSSQLSFASSVSGVLTSWPPTLGSCTGALGLVVPGSVVNQPTAYDGSGTYYWAPDLCGSAPNATSSQTPGIVALDNQGNATYFAGRANGTYGESVPAKQAWFTVIVGMAYHAGQLYVADGYQGNVNMHWIRKIDVSSGLISTIAGNGTTLSSSDYVSAMQTGLVLPEAFGAMAVTTAGHTVYGEWNGGGANNPTIRMIW